MPRSVWVAAGLAAVVAAGLVAAAFVASRDRHRLGQLLRFVPDCLALLRDLARDPEVPRSAKIVAGATVLYLASPLDLVPDFVPVLGYLDDVLVVAWALRRIVILTGRERVEDHWRGDPGTLQRMLALARVS